MAKETTVAQLIAWLATQDQNAVVQVYVGRRDAIEDGVEVCDVEDLDLSSADHVETYRFLGRSRLLLGGYDCPPK